MPRYIDADVLEKEGWTLHRTYPQDSNTMVYEIKKLSDVPTVDVVERKYGEWKVAMLDHESMGCRPKVHYCSMCNHITTFRTFFCPNCGADMRKETEDERHN